MKKFFLTSLLIAVIVIAVPFTLHAQGNFVPITGSNPIPGITDAQPSPDMSIFFNTVYKMLLGLAAVLAVIMIIWGGVEWATTDNISRKSEGRARIAQAILGLILVLLPVLVFSIINPSILNLSVNWKAITPATTGSNSAPTSNNTQTPTTITGCTKISGPVPESLLITCTASTESEANANAAQAVATYCSSSVQKATVSAKCPNPKQQYVNGQLQQVCPTPVSAGAWCSGPKFNVEVVYQGQVLLGFLSGQSTLNACLSQTNPGWFANTGWQAVGAPQQYQSPNLAYKYDCPDPNTDSTFKSIVESKATSSQPPYCYRVPVTCAYTPK